MRNRRRPGVELHPRLPRVRRAGRRRTVTIVQIESETVLSNGAKIAAVDGVDALFVGPADLSAALDTFPDWADGRVAEAVERVVAAGDDAGVPVGSLAVDPAEVDYWFDRGVDFLAVGFDAAFLAEGAGDALEAYRAAVDGRRE